MEAVGDLVVPTSEAHQGKEGVESNVQSSPSSDFDEHTGVVVDAYDNTVRKLRPRHIQLIGIAGTIGTA